MSKLRSIAMIWGAPALLWGLFTFWYTDFGGPLTEVEIAAALKTMGEREAEVETIQTLRAFMESDTGGDFVMVNLLQMNPHPPAVGGAPAGADADALMGIYMEHMLPQMFLRGSHPALFADVVNLAVDLAGIENAEYWDSIALVRYRSRRDFMEIVLHPETGARHEFKLAALAKTIAVPMEIPFYPGDPRLVLGLFLALLAALTQLFVPTARKNP